MKTLDHRGPPPNLIAEQDELHAMVRRAQLAAADAARDLERYGAAMVAGQHQVCIDIEQRHGLYGYSPQIVSIGLKAAAGGQDPDKVIDAYLEGRTA